MKKHASSYWISLISITTAAVCLGAPLNLAAADGTVPASAPASGVTVVAQPPALPYGAAEVVKMYQGGIGKDILVNYIDSNVLPFHLNADGIIYLQHLGLPQEVTTAMLRRDSELQKQAGSTAYQQQQQQLQLAQAPVAAANTAPPLVMPSTPPPVAPYAYAPDVAAPVVYPDYAYPYSYPYYGYPYYYGPNFVVGGWGFGRGFGPFRGGFDHGGFGHGGFGGRGGHR